MDKFETDSEISYHSDSLLSNASSLSGLSYYENEFTELRHLVNPTKYASPPLDRSVTPKAHYEAVDSQEKVIALQSALQASHELNTKYKYEIDSLERKFELKYHDKIELLLKNNSKVEVQLQNANKQIQRLITNYTDVDNYVTFKEKLELEKKIQDLNFKNDRVEKECALLKIDNAETLLENKNIKISLDEALTELDVKSRAIENLKEKISDQHVQIEHFSKDNAGLNEKLNVLNAKLETSEKSNNWYKEQLLLCQSDKQNYSEQLIKYKSDINDLHEQNSYLNISLSKTKSEVDAVRFQSLKEKEALFTKLETINVNLEFTPKSANSTSYESDLTANNSAVEDWEFQIFQLKKKLEIKEEECNLLKSENSDLLTKYLVLQKCHQQAENNIEQLENTKWELQVKVDFLRESLKQKETENLTLKNKVLASEVEFNKQEEEKKSVERTIETVRGQFLVFQKHYELVKEDLSRKNKECLELQNDQQQLFMQNNWQKCELEEKNKEKDILNDKLKHEISTLKTKLEEQVRNIGDLRFQILKMGKIADEKDSTIMIKQTELDNYDVVLSQYKNLHSDYENQVNSLQNKLKMSESTVSKLEDNLNTCKAELEDKNLMLQTLTEKNTQLKENYTKSIEEIIFERETITTNAKELEVEYKAQLAAKQNNISALEYKCRKVESDYGTYLKSNTDDHKAELRNMLNSESFLNIIFNKLNLDEFDNVISIKLKHLEEKLRKGYKNLENFQQRMTIKDKKVQELELMLKVKEREMVDKKKKMDRNNRTLLRKLKEHMRGRNFAEKQLKYIQDLYDSLCNKHNTMTLTLAEKDCSIASLEEFCQQYKGNYTKSKQIITNLERKLNEVTVCTNCFDFDVVKNKCLLAEQVSTQIQENNVNLEHQLKHLNDTMAVLNNKLHEKTLEVNRLRMAMEDYKKVVSELKNKECEYINNYNNLLDVVKKLEEQESICTKQQMRLETLQLEWDRSKQTNDTLAIQIQDLSLDLQQKVEHLAKMEESRTSIETRFVKETSEYENTILQLKKKIVVLQNELDNLKNDKFFLQRLSNDLKIALKSYGEQNKSLQEHLNLYAKDVAKNSNLASPPFQDLSMSGKYDETYINRLLLENKKQKPVTCEIQGCLRKLKEEIFNLQDEITRKNKQAPAE